MSDRPYSKRELDIKFSSLDEKLFDPEDGWLPRIEAQTRKHNGRLRRVELILACVVTAVMVVVAENNASGAAHAIGVLVDAL